MAESPPTSPSEWITLTVQWINEYIAGPVGQVLRMLFMAVMPLVFALITLGVAGLGDIRQVGRVGGKAIAETSLSPPVSPPLWA